MMKAIESNEVGDEGEDETTKMSKIFKIFTHANLKLICSGLGEKSKCMNLFWMNNRKFSETGNGIDS